MHWTREYYGNNETLTYLYEYISSNDMTLQLNQRQFDVIGYNQLKLFFSKNRNSVICLNNGPGQKLYLGHFAIFHTHGTIQIILTLYLRPVYFVLTSFVRV